MCDSCSIGLSCVARRRLPPLLKRCRGVVSPWEATSVAAIALRPPLHQFRCCLPRALLQQDFAARGALTRGRRRRDRLGKNSFRSASDEKR